MIVRLLLYLSLPYLVVNSKLTFQSCNIDFSDWKNLKTDGNCETFKNFKIGTRVVFLSGFMGSGVSYITSAIAMIDLNGKLGLRNQKRQMTCHTISNAIHSTVFCEVGLGTPLTVKNDSLGRKDDEREQRLHDKMMTTLGIKLADVHINVVNDPSSLKRLLRLQSDVFDSMGAKTPNSIVIVNAKDAKTLVDMEHILQSYNGITRGEGDDGGCGSHVYKFSKQNGYDQFIYFLGNKDSKETQQLSTITLCHIRSTIQKLHPVHDFENKQSLKFINEISSGLSFSIAWNCDQTMTYEYSNGVFKPSGSQGNDTIQINPYRSQLIVKKMESVDTLTFRISPVSGDFTLTQLDDVIVVKITGDHGLVKRNFSSNYKNFGYCYYEVVSGLAYITYCKKGTFSFYRYLQELMNYSKEIALYCAHHPVFVIVCTIGYFLLNTFLFVDKILRMKRAFKPTRRGSSATSSCTGFEIETKIN